MLNKESSSTSPTALVIDDNKLIRTSESLLLQHAGFQVITAADGKTGVSILQDRHDELNLVITDYSMPGKNGTEVRQALSEVSPETPVILVTGDIDKLQKETLYDFSAVINKPYEAQYFLDTARSLVS